MYRVAHVDSWKAVAADDKAAIMVLKRLVLPKSLTFNCCLVSPSAENCQTILDCKHGWGFPRASITNEHDSGTQMLNESPLPSTPSRYASKVLVFASSKTFGLPTPRILPLASNAAAT